LYTFNTATNVFSTVWQTSATYSVLRGLSFAPSEGSLNPTPSTTGTGTFTPSSLPSVTQLPSLSHNASPYPSISLSGSYSSTASPPTIPDGNNLFVVRLGNGTAGLLNSNVAQPAFVDEIRPNGQLRRTIAMPVQQIGTQRSCTLTGSTYAHEGFGSLSLDGNFFVFPCYNAQPGTISWPGATERVIARINAMGVVDTSIVVPDFASPNVITSVVTVDAQNEFWCSGSQFESNSLSSPSPSNMGVNGGVRYFNAASGTSIALYTASPVKALTVTGSSASDGQLYVSKPYLNSADDSQ
jgi:hypothetical protein